MAQNLLHSESNAKLIIPSRDTAARLAIALRVTTAYGKICVFSGRGALVRDFAFSSCRVTKKFRKQLLGCHV